MKIVALSGWGQPHDALKNIAPDASHIDYARHDSVEAALAEIAKTDPELAIGWSLGGQLLVRAAATKLIKPRALVLIAPPFQFVQNPGLMLGMKGDLYEKFHDNVKRNPARSLHKSWELVAMDDVRQDAIRERMNSQDKQAVLEKDWLRWLSLLKDFSSADLNFTDFPATLLIHGANDRISSAEQAHYFKNAIPHAKLSLWKGVGHAPHWHDEKKLKTMIEDFIGV